MIRKTWMCEAFRRMRNDWEGDWIPDLEASPDLHGEFFSVVSYRGQHDTLEPTLRAALRSRWILGTSLLTGVQRTAASTWRPCCKV